MKSHLALLIGSLLLCSGVATAARQPLMIEEWRDVPAQAFAHNVQLNGGAVGYFGDFDTGAFLSFKQTPRALGEVFAARDAKAIVKRLDFLEPLKAQKLQDALLSNLAAVEVYHIRPGKVITRRVEFMRAVRKAGVAASLRQQEVQRLVQAAGVCLEDVPSELMTVTEAGRRN